ncbi:MAG: T9SS type A sorting domain-containing protein [Bacteroidota bacterium]
MIRIVTIFCLFLFKQPVIAQYITGSAADATGTGNDGYAMITIGSVTEVPLPIELTAFSAERCDSYVCLTWQTAAETNNDYFTIERSLNIADFEKMGIIDGAGNSTSILNYSLIDENPYKGSSYYRLKQTDFDGKFTYSNIVMVDFFVTHHFNFDIFPNPGSGENINLLINGNTGEEVLVVVYDITGRESYSKVLLLQTEGDNVYAIDESKKLSPGVYIVTATSNQSIYSKRLIVK